MPRLTTKLPAYCKHNSGQAFVRLDGRMVYLGTYGTKLSKARYDEVITQWLANGRRLPNEPVGLTVNELILAYLRHAETYYRKADGTPTSEQGNIKHALRIVRQSYGGTDAAEFGPLALKAVREAMIDLEWCRGNVNRSVDRVKRMFKWGVAQEMIPATVFHALQTLPGLRRGRSRAKETEPVKPVPEAHIPPVLKDVSRQVAGMIELQLLAGMRPGEVVIMRGCDVQTSGAIWTYTPASHKTEHHGHRRSICLGPKAQEIVREFLKRDITAYLFDPRHAAAEHNANRRKERATPLYPSHVAAQDKKRKKQPKRTPRDHYDVASYRRAIRRACERCDIPLWHPHQLRHNAATRLRKQYGIEVARAVLGHRSAGVTEIYAEMDQGIVAKAMGEMG